jgi:hypothetical protein
MSQPVRGGNFAASALAYTSAGEVVEETNVHFDSSGNVGVGTSAPEAKLHVSGNTILDGSTYRKRRDWNRNALAYVYLGNVRTAATTGIRLDVSLNNSNSGYNMCQFQITLDDQDTSHQGGKMIYSGMGVSGESVYRGVELGYVFVGTSYYEYQLWLKDPTYSTQGPMDAYLNCQGYYNFDTEVSDVAQGGAAPTNFQLGVPGVLVRNTGNVGIGTTSPGEALHVKGNILSAPVGKSDIRTFGIYNGTNADFDYYDTILTKSLVRTGDTTFTIKSDGFNKGFTAIQNQWRNIVFYTYKDSGSGDVAVTDLSQYERMRINLDGNVGIGTPSPFSKLSLKPTTIYDGETGSSFTSAMGGLELIAANTNNARWNMVVHENNDLYFLYTITGTSGWGISGYLQDSANVNQIDFTGQHRNFIYGVPYSEYQNLEGLIVSANKNKYYDINEDLTTGANAIQISQSLPLVSLSTKEKDKACFGVISGSEDPDRREYSQGSFVSVVQKQRGDRRAFINSVGEGAMWVVNTAGSLESGDYITTSNVAGYGQKQDSEFLANYTVAKITMDCDFEPATQPIQQILKELANVNYWVKTTYSNVTQEEYSNLADENRTTEDETYYTKDIERKYTYKPTITVTAEDPWDDVSIFPNDVTYAEYSNLEANVQNTYTLTYTQNDFETMRYEKTTVSNVTSEDAWDAVHIEPPTVTYAEYSNLEANVQNTFTLTYTKSVTTTTSPSYYSNLAAEEQELYTAVYLKTVTEDADADTEGADAHIHAIYKKIEREETKEEPVEDVDVWVLEVRQELVNVLDEHGQLQWEDTDQTEKAYKIRYLDASGAITDEANAVHIAAFVGCTYHCG